MEFRVLGPVQLRVGDRPVDIGPVKLRTVLAALLIDGRVVPPETLIGRVWGDSRPAQVRNVMYTYVARLRRILEQASAESGEGEGERVRLDRRSGGYLLEMPPDRVDLARFVRLMEQARAAACDEERALLSRQALGLWQGPPLRGLSGAWVTGVRERLERQRLDALVQLADAELRLGTPQGVIEPLRDALAERPLSELLIGRLLRALYGAGRSAEALECYARARGRIIEEVGAEPSIELRRLHEAILREALPAAPFPAAPSPAAQPAPLPALAQPTSPVQALPPPAPATPCLLPADLMDFTGRAGSVRWLRRTLAAGTGTATPVAAILGGAGQGKTALAVHTAHLLREVFTDGQLYLDLRGRHPDRLDRARALERLLRGLGIRAALIPDDVAERAELYRNLLSDRRMLVVLDDAAQEEQVQPLLPGSASCALLVTSRTRLSGLSCARLQLAALEPEDAVRMLKRIAGAERLAGDPQGSRDLARLCEGLPLALRVAGSRLVARPHWTVARLVSRLAEEGSRLDELTHGGLSVRASFDGAYRHLDPQARCLFRRLDRLRRADFTQCAAQSLLPADSSVIEDALERLVDAHLLQPSGTGAAEQSYHLCDLARLYARERARTEDGPKIEARPA
jgi:DNA-binding SARP family transcriptional activator